MAEQSTGPRGYNGPASRFSSKLSVLPSLCSSWTIFIIELYIYIYIYVALTTTPNIDCYRVGAAPKVYWLQVPTFVSPILLGAVSVLG